MVKQDHILIIKLGALGDFIQSLGPIRAIRHHHPNARITLLTTKPFKNFAQESDYVDDIWIDTRPKFYQISQWISLRKQLNQGQFIRVYDLQNNDRTSIYLKLLSPKPEWVGSAKGASHRNTSPERTAGLAFYGHVQTLGLAGIDNIKIDSLDWIQSDISKFEVSHPYALIVPGCAPTRPEKRWPAQHYITLCQNLSNQNIQPVIIGTDSEINITKAISDNCPNALDLTGKTSLFDIAVLAKSAQFAIGNDTGPMHIIAPTGCRTLVLFSKNSNPKRHAPLGNHVRTVQQDNLRNLLPEKVLEEIKDFG